MNEEKEAENIRVAVRCRPQSQKEIKEQSASCFKCENGTAILTNPLHPEEIHVFGYDFVYDSTSLQSSVYQDIGVPLVERAFGGYNGTIFAYGQTGSGKTFSMLGSSSFPDLEGLIPRINRGIFERIQKEKKLQPKKQFLVECSFFEIYNEIIYDLLDSTGNLNKKGKMGLEIKEHAILGIYVKDLHERVVETQEQVKELMLQGQLSRTVGSTHMNSESSRSHSIFVIKIHQKFQEDESKSLFAKINLVDLAGSERANSTGAIGDRLKEGANINKSLSALGNVINALVEVSRTGKRVFIPYRNSKLTRVLQESLGGNSLCSMLATLSPASCNFIETLSTLKYASRAKSIKVNATKNEQANQISKLNEEIATLKKKLEEKTNVDGDLMDTVEKKEIVERYERQIAEMDLIRKQTWDDKVKLSKEHEAERKRMTKEKAKADKLIEEERRKRWKLLEDKTDIELALSTGKEHCFSSDSWCEMAAKIKQLEEEVGEQRAIVMVFKDAFDEDLRHRKKNRVYFSSGLDSCGSSSGISVDEQRVNEEEVHEENKDFFMEHITLNQSLLKLRSLRDENKKLLRMEMEWIERINELEGKIEEAFHELESSLETNSKEKKKKEDLHGISILLKVFGNYKSKVRSSIENESKKIFQIKDVGYQIVHILDKDINTNSNNHNQDSIIINNVQDSSSLASSFASMQEKSKPDFNFLNTKEWQCKLIDIRSQLKNALGQSEPQTINNLEKSPTTTTTLVPSSLPSSLPLGMESRTISDERITASTGKESVIHARLDSKQHSSKEQLQEQKTNSCTWNCWSPAVMNDFQYLQIDLSRNHCVTGISIQGGKWTCFLNFNLQPVVLKQWIETYTFDSLLGDPDQTYQLVGHLISWESLLQTTKVPYKLLNRPPVRFLHDIITLILENTGYAANLYQPYEMDYDQLPTKQHRMEYLTKILQYVGKTLEKEIPTKANNILAGIETKETLLFLEYLTLGAMQHLLTTREKMQSSNEQDILGWVSMYHVETSEDGIYWKKQTCQETQLEEFQGNQNPYQITMNHLQTTCIARYLRLLPKQWENVIALKMEVYGHSFPSPTMEDDQQRALEQQELIHTLVLAMEILVEKAKTTWKNLQKSQETKQKVQQDLLSQQLASISNKYDMLKLQWRDNEEKQIVYEENKIVLEMTIEQLNQKLEESIQGLKKTKESYEKTSMELGKSSKDNEKFLQEILSLGKENDKLKTQVLDLIKTKTDMEALNDALSHQITEKNKEDEDNKEGLTRKTTSDLTFENEFMKNKVQLDELKRNYETCEKTRNDQENLIKSLETCLEETKISNSIHLKTIELLQKEKEDYQLIKKEIETKLVKEETARKTQQDRLRVLEIHFKEAQEQAVEAQSTIQNSQNKIQELYEKLQTVQDLETEKVKQNIIDSQTKEIKWQAENERLELRCRTMEDRVESLSSTLKDTEDHMKHLQEEKETLEEQMEELHLQIQVLTEERDTSRQKEEQLFLENANQEEEIEGIRNGYIWVTDRMNDKEDEIAELREQLVKYESLVSRAILKDQSKLNQVTPLDSTNLISKLYQLIFQDESSSIEKQRAQLEHWIVQKLSSSTLSSSSLANENENPSFNKKEISIRDKDDCGDDYGDDYGDDNFDD